MKLLKKVKLFALVVGLGIIVAGVASDANVNAYETETVKVQDGISYGIGVSPAKLENIELTPGLHYESSYKVFNEGINDIEFIVIVSPFGYAEDYSGHDFINTSSYNQIQEWVTIDRGPISLKSGEMITLPFTIDVPEGKSIAGGQYFAFINRITPESESQHSGEQNIQGVKQIGLAVGTKVDGPELNACGKIIEQEAKFWQQHSPIKTTLKVENCGNIDFKPKTTLKVENWFGGGVLYETAEGEAVSGIIMPETTRDFEINWDGAPMVGVYKVTQTVKYLDQSVELNKIVLLLPIWIVIAIIVIIILIILAIVFNHKSKKSHGEKGKSKGEGLSI